MPAAVANRKKSYHSIVVPMREASSTVRGLVVLSAGAGVATVDDMGVLCGGRAGNGSVTRAEGAREAAEVDVATGHQTEAEREHAATVPSSAGSFHRTARDRDPDYRQVWPADVVGGPARPRTRAHWCGAFRPARWR